MTIEVFTPDSPFPSVAKSRSAPRSKLNNSQLGLVGSCIFGIAFSHAVDPASGRRVSRLRMYYSARALSEQLEESERANFDKFPSRILIVTHPRREGLLFEV
jgi:hypothetical protein